MNIIKTIHKDNSYVCSLLLLSDGRLASCSNDRTIKIFNMNNYHCDITIKGHNNGVNYISELDNNKLISCSYKEIKIWSINQLSYQCDYTIHDAYSDYIGKVIQLTNSRIASCSKDNTVKIWNSNHPYNLIKTLNGHFDVRSIIQLKDKDILISGNNNNILRKWNLLTYQCDTIIKNVNCFDSNSLLEIDKNRLIVGGINEITIVNISNDIIEQQIKNNRLGYVFSLVQLANGNILCGCKGGLICLYDVKLYTITFREDKIHDNNVTCLLNINKYQIISCSWDYTIKIWNY